MHIKISRKLLLNTPNDNYDKNQKKRKNKDQK